MVSPPRSTPTVPRGPNWIRTTVYLIPLVVAVCVLISTRAARIDLLLRIQPGHAALRIDGHDSMVSWPGGMRHAVPSIGAADERLFNIDGTDNSGTLTANPATYPHDPYFRFVCWIRDCSGYSQWQDFSLTDDGTGRVLLRHDSPLHLAALLLPARFTLRGTLQRPDTGTAVGFSGSHPLELSIDPDTRQVRFGDRSRYYPYDWHPYLAEIGWTLSRTCIGAYVALGVSLLLAFLASAVAALGARIPRTTAVLPDGPANPAPGAPIGALPLSASRIWPRTTDLARLARRYGPRALPAVPWLGTLGLLVALLEISDRTYQRLPRVLDACSYYFQALIFRSGHLAASLPAAAAYFPGPFVIRTGTHWFSMYPPGTSLAIALGMLAGVPWAVEPACGAIAALLLSALARRWYGWPVALLSLALLACSPFYLFLASSYMSHMISLFALLLFLVGTDHLATGGGKRWALLAGTGVGYALLTRELSLVLFALPVLAFYGVRCRAALRGWLLGGDSPARRRANVLAFCVAAPIALSLLFHFFYTWRLTGNPLSLPRTMFDPHDQYGFGNGKGWYGQHTPAAGLLNTEDQLTSLLIHLFGWPYYLTLAFFLIPALTGRLRAHDLLLYGLAGSMLVGYAAYFYHGIAFGPRYLFESLPAYVVLTARGVVETAALATLAARRLAGLRAARAGGAAAVAIVLATLVACNLRFYLPRQTALYYDYIEQTAGGLAYERLHPSWMHRAVVYTSDYLFYAEVLFPLNDPALRGDIVYAYLDQGQSIVGLARYYPHRAFYYVDNAYGTLDFLRVAGPAVGGSAPVLPLGVRPGDTSSPRREHSPVPPAPSHRTGRTLRNIGLVPQAGGPGLHPGPDVSASGTGPATIACRAAAPRCVSSGPHLARWLWDALGRW